MLISGQVYIFATLRPKYSRLIWTSKGVPRKIQT